MKLIKIEKYLDSPTASCDKTSNVNDCYFYVPNNLRDYFDEGDTTFIDLETKKSYSFPITSGRELRITQFTQYIKDKKITMGDKVSIYLLQNNDDTLSFYLDVEHTNFFLQTDSSDNLYKLYITDTLKDILNTERIVELSTDVGNIKVEKVGDEYTIEGVTEKKFILEEENGVYKIIKLTRPSVTDMDAELVEDASILSKFSSVARTKRIKELFSEYINNLDIQTKKIDKRIKYLDEILPKRINSANPISIFNISNIEELKEIRNTLRSGGENWEWDREGSYAGEILQTVNYYIKFLKTIESKNDTNFQVSNEQKVNINKGIFKNFLKQQEISPDNIDLVKISANIQFNIGQPNTGKSYNFEESKIFDGVEPRYYNYLKIPVSGGIGNEYKGLQNTDLAITYDPIKEELRFGEFLQMIMSAIVNPKVPHVVFLDDFHNQDISSLLSEYTPLFKGQQKREINEVAENAMFNEFSTIDEFIKGWNEFIDTHCADVPIVPLTNRISGESLKLVYPANFYLLGAANFNENSLNIFADWEDRAVIDYIDPIESFTKNDDNEFLKCCKELNTNLKEILESKKIFDYEKYCFGMWKIVDKDGKIESDLEEQKKIIDFFFSMIKNSLKYNNKNSEINSIGWELIQKIQSNDWFKENIEEINSTEIDYKILHKHKIYEDEI